VVLIAFLITELCFGRKVALLSSIVFVLNESFVGKFPNLLREDIAILFFLTIVYCIFLTPSSRKRLIVSIVAVPALMMAHYGTIYFAIFGLLLIFLSTKMYNRVRIRPRARPDFGNRKSFISMNFLMYSLVVGAVWLLVVVYPILLVDIKAAVDTLKALFELEARRYSYLQQYVVVSSLGVFSTIIQWLERILAVIGLLVVLKNYRNAKAFSFAFLGGGILALLVVFTVLPTISLTIDLDRVLRFALPCYSAFIAVSIIKLKNRFKNWTVVVSTFVVILIFLRAIDVPILFSAQSDLGREDIVFSFSHVLTYYEPSDFQFAKWAQNWTNQSAVFAADHIGHNVLLFAKRISVEPRVMNSTDAILLIESGKTDYFLALLPFPDYLQFRSNTGSEVVLSSEEVATLLGSNRLNRIYDNQRVLTFGYVNSSK
jgi:uncharacterized membrane protein